jgi:hypothetical protein
LTGVERRIIIMNQFCGKCSAKLNEDDAAFCPGCDAALPSAFPEPEVFSSEPTVDTAVTPVAEPVPEVAIVSETLPPEPAPEVAAVPEATAAVPEVAVAAASEPPPMPPSVAVATVAKSPKPPRSTGMRVLFALLSVLVSIVLLMTITLGQAVFVARETVQPSTVQAMARAVIEEIEFGDVRVGGAISDMNVEMPDFARETSGDGLLNEVIFNSIHEYYITTYNLQPDEIRRALNNREVNRLVADIVDKGIEFIMTGENERQRIISTESVVRLVRSNAAELENITGFAFDANEEYERILRESLARSGVADVTWGDLDNSSDSVLHDVRGFFATFNRWSLWILIAAIVVTVGLIVALVAMNRRRTNALLFVGIPAIVSGGGLAISSFLTNLILRWIVSEAGFEDLSRGAQSAVDSAFSSVTNAILMAGLFTLVAGVLMIVARVVVGAVFKKR